MKTVITLFLLTCSIVVKAQNGAYDVKVYTTDFHLIKGHLKVVNKEGIAVDSYDGKYHILHIAAIQKIKVRKRGLTIGAGAGKGALTGLTLGAGIAALIQEEKALPDLILLTGTLAASGAVIGTATGIVAEQVNRKLVLQIRGDQARFEHSFQKLIPYINTIAVYSKVD